MKQVVGDFSLPSYTAFSRYLSGYFEGFYPYFPFTHQATFSFDDCIPELVLSFASVGAIYRYETKTSMRMFFAAKAILHKRQQRREKEMMQKLKINDGSAGNVLERNIIQEIGCLICLLMTATWNDDPDIQKEGFHLENSLARCVRESGLSENLTGHSYTPLTWREWAAAETERRTKMLAFCFLNVRNLIYNNPPVLLASEFKLRLPCSCPEWTAPDETAWRLMRQGLVAEQPSFDEAFQSLSLHDPIVSNNQAPPSPTANFVLIHALLQDIVRTRQLFPLGINTPALPVECQSRFQYVSLSFEEFFF